MFIDGLLGTCSSFSKLLMCLCNLNFFFVWLLFNPCFCLQECYEVFLKTLFEKSVSVEKFVILSKYLTVIYLLEKKIISILVSFRQCYPTISEWVAPSLEFWGSIRKGRTVTKAMLGHLSSNPNVLDHFYPRQPFRGNLWSLDKRATSKTSYTQWPRSKATKWGVP